MPPLNARIKFYVRTGREAPSDFRSAVLAARQANADEFTYKELSFHVDKRGAAFIEQSLDDPVPTIIGKDGELQVKLHVITATDPSVHPLAQAGFYDSVRLGFSRVQATVDHTGELTGSPKIAVSGAPFDQVVRTFKQILAGEITPTHPANSVLVIKIDD